ncbi:MAG: alpha-2-macroglobulin, partial [Deltaproteobacteria bacterium]|nr:alpha-2-macroglobulin [Deltaproteobacteria bacterium]
MRLAPNKPARLARALLALTSLLAVAACDRCAPTGGALADGRIVPGGDRALLELAPLPPAPALDIAPGALPGIPTGPLSVVVSRPQGTLRGNERPAITFNKPLVPLGADPATHPVPATLAPAVQGEWRWLGSATAEFVPRAPFPYATDVVVTVNPALKALDGQGLDKPTSFSFVTLPPELYDVEPRRNWPWLDAGKPIRLTFNQPVVGLEGAVLTADGAPVAFTIDRVVDVDLERAQKEGRPARGRTTFGQPTRYELSLKEGAPPGAQLRLSLDGVRGREGTATISGTAVRWRTRGPLRIESARFCSGDDDRCPQGPLVLVVTGEADLQTVKPRLHVRAVEGAAKGKDVALNVDDAVLRYDTQEWPDNGRWTLVVDGSFQPGRTYDVVVDAGVKDDAGQAAPAFATRARTTDVAPWLRVPTPLVLIESVGDGALPVETANLRAVQTRVWPQDLPAMARFLARDDLARAPEGEAIERQLPLEYVHNAFVRTPLPLDDVLPGGRPRLFVADVWSDESKETAERARVVGQITDLAVHAKIGAVSSLVWVTSLASGTPVPGATVAVWDRVGDKRHEAATDADGLARLPGAVDMLGGDGDDESDWFVPYALVSATKGADTGVTLSTWRGEFGWVETAWDGAIPDVEAVVFAERGIYRPGEQVFVKGVVRTRARGELSVPAPDSELLLSLSDGDAGSKQQQRVPLSRFGTFDAVFTLPANAPLGWWSVDVSAKLQGRPVNAGTSFRVEQYRAPQFKVDVHTPAGPVLSGAALQATVEARYLFGAPMPGATVEATVTRTPTSFSPPDHDGYVFGVEVDGWSDTESAPSSDTWSRVTGTIAADGSFVVDAGGVEATGGRAWRYSVEANVTDVSRQAVAGRDSTVVHPASVYAGVRVPDGFASVGTPADLRIMAVDLQGKPVAGRKVAVVVKRRDWKNVKQRDEWSGMAWLRAEPVDVDVGGCGTLTSAVAPVSCPFTADKPGLHVVEVQVTDEAGRTQRTRTSFYVAGGGWVSWRRSEDDSVELVADKDVYAPGDTARVMVKAPWPKAEAIVTVEREGVRSARRITLEGAAQAIDVPLTDAEAPNVFVGVVMVRGRVDDKVAIAAGAPVAEIDPGRPQVKVGTINLRVRSTKKDLRVAIDAGAGTKRPGQKLALSLHVKDDGGKGAPAEVTLWAVDEAVLRLTSYAPPSLDARFHPQRGLSVRLGEPLIHLVRRRTYGTKGEPGGDGGAPGSGFRSDFKTTAWFLPSVVTDADGRATVEVKLPDDLTTYRVMAVAVGADDRFGEALTEVVVQKPVMALPALPRLARVGDRFEAGVVVHAAGGAGDRDGIELDVSAVVDGDQLQIAGEATRAVRLSGKGIEVRFPFVARKDGVAMLRFVARKKGDASADGQDALQLRLPVLLPVVVE